MKLTVKERIAIINLLPRQGDIATMKISAELTVLLGLKTDETKALSFKINDGRLQWDIEKEKEIGECEIPFSQQARLFIVEILKRLEKNRKLSLDCVTLWVKFCEQKDI